MYLSIKKTLLLILGLALVIGTIASPTKKSSQKSSSKNSSPAPPSNGQKNVCRSFTDNFKNSRIVSEKKYNGNPTSADWIDTCGVSGTYSFSGGALNANLLKPQNEKRTKGKDGYYNKNLGQGLAFNSTYKMLYGKVSMKVKANGVGGCVTALVTMSENGDEIDWELVGKDVKHCQSNYFYDRILIYGVNGGVHQLPNGGKIDSGYHTYAIDWKPDSITWSIDDKPVRTLQRSSTYANGTYRFPCHPSYVQLGIWDGSGAEGTAQWSNGPIEWSKQSNKLTSYIEEVSISCDPTYNTVVSH
ncbi:12874_t:CDS:2 [Dentiscutata heterogama]|uniref:12874_t:CDS:1 n=1 Tax=Dentiscutata heterogama TaxID=1316150 RepID=A0ACA9LN68_9GLOM|nr:12874_t:CDS:2 [Dentiscutata heterogama]